MDATFTVGTRVRVKVANNYADESGNYADGIVTGEIPGGYRIRLDDGRTLSSIPGQMRAVPGEIAMDSVMRDAIDWTADRKGMSPSRQPKARDAVRYVHENYPGGWDAFERDMTRTVQL